MTALVETALFADPAFHFGFSAEPGQLERAIRDRPFRRISGRSPRLTTYESQSHKGTLYGQGLVRCPDNPPRLNRGRHVAELNLWLDMEARNELVGQAIATGAPQNGTAHRR